MTFEKALTAKPEFSGVSGHMVGETGATAANGLGGAGKPVRVQLSRKKGWRMPPGTVSVARGPGHRPYANPFVIGKDGTREECIAKFRAEWEQPATEEGGLFKAIMATLLAGIRGKNLACWCPLDKPCHADVLLELANAPEQSS